MITFTLRYARARLPMTIMTSVQATRISSGRKRTFRKDKATLRFLATDVVNRDVPRMYLETFANEETSIALRNKYFAHIPDFSSFAE